MAADSAVATFERDNVSRGTADGVMAWWQCRSMRLASSLMGRRYLSGGGAAGSNVLVVSGKNLAAMVYPVMSGQGRLPP